MSIPHLIQSLRELQVGLQLVGDQLKINAPKGTLTPQMVQQLREKKAEIIAFLKSVREVEYAPIPPAGEMERYPLSSAQKRLYLLQQLQPDSIAYNMPLNLPLGTEVDVEKLESVFRRLIARHESLRTAFVSTDGVPAQVIREEIDFSIPCVTAGSDEDVALRMRDFIRPFDLSRAPMLRVQLIKTPDGHYLFLMDMHHIIVDGASQVILQQEFGVLEQGRPLPPLNVRYKDFSQWQNSRKESPEWKKEETFWLNSFAEEVPVLALPCDFPRPLMQSAEGRTVDFLFTKEETRALKKLASAADATLYMTLLAVYNVLLSKLSCQEDIVVGTPIEGRRHPDLKPIIGMFVNTLALRNRPEGSKGFGQFLQEVKGNTLEAFENQDYQFEDLVEKVSIQRDTSRNPLFDVMFNLLNQAEYKGPVPTAPEEGTYEHKPGTSKFDLNLTSVDMGEHFFFNLEYCSALFEPRTIERTIGYFRKLVRLLEAEPNRQLSDIEIISEEEKRQVMVAFNDTRADFPAHKTLHRMFQDQVEKHPHRVAVFGPSGLVAFTDGGGEAEPGSPLPDTVVTLTYGQLNRRVNLLARTLRQEGVQPDTLVGVLVERSVEMVVGLFGILKAGGAYLPIDTEYPEDRKTTMLEDSQAQWVVSGWRSQSEKPQLSVPARLFNLWDPQLYTGDGSDLPEYATPNFLGYVIYTSGSTGKPKGLMLEHRNLVNLIQFGYDFTNLDFSAVLQFSTISFDVSFHEIFSSLLWGGKIRLIRKEDRSHMETLFSIIERSDLKTVFLPISLLKIIFSDAYYREIFPRCVRHIQTAGEQVVVSAEFAAYLKAFHIYLHNHYGPAETHVITTYTADPNDVIPRLPPIGKPISNTWLYILDAYGHVQPVGVPGELFASGMQVGRGYWGREDLTAERFLPDPFKPGERMYKTGDLARWLPDGNIDFLGRIDHQVKIRGFRIEPGEIESQLANHPQINEAVVLVLEDPEAGGGSGKYICAYYVASGDEEVEITKLREYLEQRLPDYMVPSYFIPLEKIPLTPNGKVARRQLPVPDKSSARENQAGPRNELEKELVLCWGEVLNRNTEAQALGIDDNFFASGGHSLKATLLISKMHRAFDVLVPLAVLFKYPTIRGLSRYIQDARKEQYLTIPAAPAQEVYPLSPAQKRVFILQQLEPQSVTYNMPYIESFSQSLDREKLEEVFRLLIRRHECLRTSFFMKANQPVQQVHEEVPFQVEYYEAGDAPPVEASAPSSVSASDAAVVEGFSRYIRPFDLAKAPLMRVCSIDTGKGNNALLVDMHHIITDGTSQAVLREEFSALWQETSAESLPPLPIRYIDFACWQNSSLGDSKMKDQERYWLDVFDGEIPVLNLPVDSPRPAIRRFEGYSLHFFVDEMENRALFQVTRTADITLFMAILALFNVLMAKLSGQEDVVVGSPIAARRHPDLQNIVGMFINTLALRNYPAAGKSFAHFLEDLKERTLGALDNQEYPFEELVEKAKVRRDTARNPLFDVMVNLLNQADFTGPTPGEGSGSGGSGQYVHVACMSKFDISLTAVDYGGRVGFNLEYSRHLFNPATIERMVLYFKRLIRLLGDSPQLPLGEIELITEAEKEQIINDFNDTSADFPSEITIHGWFQQQVERTPGNIALICPPSIPGTPLMGEELRSVADHPEPCEMGVQGEPPPGARRAGALGEPPEGRRRHGEIERLTYEQLDQQVHRLACLLQQQGVEPGCLVAIMVERSIQMMVAVYAVLKAGGAYLPIDPHYPEERITYMLADSGAALLVVDGKPENLSFEGCIIDLSVTGEKEEGSETGHVQLRPDGGPCSPAYVIYTSGSTGKPKGVMIEHRSVANRLHWMQSRYPLDAGDVILQKTAVTFDVSVWELFWWSFYGASLCLLAPGGEKNPADIVAAIQSCAVTTMHFVPSMLNAFLDHVEALEDAAPLASLRRVFASGEALTLHQVERFNRALYETNETILVNLYGPTEATVDVSYFDCSGVESLKKIPIGKPVQNTQLLILDSSFKLQPVGVAGELCITGVQLGRGYLNRPQLTLEKFVPFSHLAWLELPDDVLCEGVFYRTGDLCRWLPDGNIEFLGRIDHQVKIRGFRIELGEIENRLSTHPGIKETIVMARKQETAGGEYYLCAYVVPADSAAAPDVPQLREHLGASLPDYMIPSHFIQLDTLPLLPNGKINRKALDTLGKRLDTGVQYVAPAGEKETAVAAVWREVLDLGDDKIGIDDNFFEIGGNSINVIRLSNSLKETMGIDVPVVLLFKYLTIRSFIRYLETEHDSQPEKRPDRSETISKAKQGRADRRSKRKAKR